MNDLTVSNGAPTIFGTLSAANHINALMSQTFEVEGKGWREQAKLISEIETALASADSLRQAIQAAQRPATAREVGRCLYDITEAFRHFSDDNQRFGELLTLSVLRRRPGIGPLEVGCIKVYETFRRRPTIADVLEAIDAADSQLRRAIERLDGMLPGQLADLRQTVAEGRRGSELER